MKVTQGKLSIDEFDKKYLIFYSGSSRIDVDLLPIIDVDLLPIINKKFYAERTNPLTNQKERQFIRFFVNRFGRLAYNRTSFSNAQNELIYFNDTSTWNGLATTNLPFIRTEEIYNYYGELAHQIIEYSYTNNSLLRTKMYRYDKENQVTFDSLVYKIWETEK